MISIKKTALYTLLVLLLIQWLLPATFALSDVYPNRLDYTLMIDHNNMRDVDAVLQQIQREYKQQTEKKAPLIILGDSVLFGSPGNSDQVFHRFWPTHEGEPPVYNLSLPANQIGDIYTMLLKLDAYGIPTDRVLFNIRYASFVPRDNGPRAVFWFGNDLRKLDHAAYKTILPQLQSAGFQTPDTPYAYFQRALKEDWLPALSIVRYQDYFRQRAQYAFWEMRSIPRPDDALGDPRPWYVKKEAYGESFGEFLTDPQLIQSFTDEPFDLTLNNPDVWFLDKIMNRQKGKQTYVVLTGTNHELMKEEVNRPGFQANLQAIDRLMASYDATYINLEGVLPDEFFTDHTHFTPQGNEQLANLLWPYVNQ